MEPECFYEKLGNAPEDLLSDNPLTHPHGYCVIDETRHTYFLWLKDPTERDAWVQQFKVLKSTSYEEVLWSGTWGELVRDHTPFACILRGEFRGNKDSDSPISEEEFKKYLKFVAEYGA